MAGPLLIVLHVIANLVWIGSIVSVAVVTASSTAEVAIRGRLAVDSLQTARRTRLHRLVRFGVTRLALDPHYYFVQTKFMHAKLLLALW